MVGAGAGVLLAARQISGPWRPPLPYAFSPFEVQAEATDVTFSSGDGTRLSGWWFDRPAPTDGTPDQVVVVSHGYHSSKADMLGIGPGLWRAGLTVLLYDFRGAGDSEDGPQSLAHYEQADLTAAIDLAQERRPGAEISLVGFSMGAAVSLLVAATDQRVRRVVADSSFADMHGVIATAAAGLRLPPVPLVTLVDHATRLRYGYRFGDVRPEAVVGRISPRPLLLLHGDADEMIPVEHAHRLAAAAGPGSELRITPGAGHCGAYFLDRPGYIAQVAHFLKTGG